MDHQYSPTPARVQPKVEHNPQLAAKIVFSGKEFAIPRDDAAAYQKAAQECINHIKLKKSPQNEPILVQNFSNNGTKALEKLTKEADRPVAVVPTNTKVDHSDLKAAALLTQDALKKSKKPLTPKEYTQLFLNKLEETQKKQVVSAGNMVSTTSGASVEQKFNKKTGKYEAEKGKVSDTVKGPIARTTTNDISTAAKTQNAPKLAQKAEQSGKSQQSSAPTPKPTSLSMTPTTQHSWLQRQQQKKLEEQQALQAKQKSIFSLPDLKSPKPPGVIDK